MFTVFGIRSNYCSVFYQHPIIDTTENLPPAPPSFPQFRYIFSSFDNWYQICFELPNNQIIKLNRDDCGNHIISTPAVILITSMEGGHFVKQHMLMCLMYRLSIIDLHQAHFDTEIS